MSKNNKLQLFLKVLNKGWIIFTGTFFILEMVALIIFLNGYEGTGDLGEKYFSVSDKLFYMGVIND